MNQSSTNKKDEFLGLKVKKEYAESLRKLLVQENLLIRNYKPIKEDNFILFPVKEQTKLINLEFSSTILFIYNLVFNPAKNIQNITEIVLAKCGELNNNILPIKYDIMGEIALLRLDSEKTTKSIRECIAKQIVLFHPKIKAVKNKLGKVDSQIRVFPLEHLYGLNITETVHREYGLKIFFDINKTYFNPRLAEEHKRISHLVTPNEQILDMFTGVGGFPLHIASNMNSFITAVDINPDAIRCLQKSIEKNDLKGTIIPKVGDSSKIITNLNFYDRIIMNLPEQSKEYLSIAEKFIKNNGIIHIYIFTRHSPNFKQEIKATLTKYLNSSFIILNLFKGRDVSPSKIQVNIDLKITKSNK